MSHWRADGPADAPVERTQLYPALVFILGDVARDRTEFHVDWHFTLRKRLAVHHRAPTVFTTRFDAPSANWGLVAPFYALRIIFVAQSWLVVASVQPALF